MAWQTSNRRRRLPKNWPHIRRAILERDHGQCQHVREDTGHRCLAPATDVDHINRGDDHRPSNLQALCAWHHKHKSAMEGGHASAAARRRDNGFTHPGLT